MVSKFGNHWIKLSDPFLGCKNIFSSAGGSNPGFHTCSTADQPAH